MWTHSWCHVEGIMNISQVAALAIEDKQWQWRSLQEVVWDESLRDVFRILVTVVGAIHLTKPPMESCCQSQWNETTGDKKNSS